MFMPGDEEGGGGIEKGEILPNLVVPDAEL